MYRQLDDYLVIIFILLITHALTKQLLLELLLFIYLTIVLIDSTYYILTI